MSSDSWLNEREQRLWRSYLFVAHEVEADLDRQLQRDAGMPNAYYGILVALSEAPDAQLRMTELADRMNFSTSRLTHAVNAMEANGWVRRERCEADGRGLFARLQEPGWNALEQAAPGHVAEVRRLIFDRLDAAQLDAFGAILDTIAAALRSDDADPSESVATLLTS